MASGRATCGQLRGRHVRSDPIRPEATTEHRREAWSSGRWVFGDRNADRNADLEEVPIGEDYHVRSRLVKRVSPGQVATFESKASTTLESDSLTAWHRDPRPRPNRSWAGGHPPVWCFPIQNGSNADQDHATVWVSGYPGDVVGWVV